MAPKGLQRVKKHVRQHIAACACRELSYVLNTYLFQTLFHTASEEVMPLLLCMGCPMIVLFEESPTVLNPFPCQLAVILWHDQQVNFVLMLLQQVFCKFLHCGFLYLICNEGM